MRANTNKRNLRKLYIILVVLLALIVVVGFFLLKQDRELLANIFFGIAMSLFAWIIVECCWQLIGPDTPIIEDVRIAIAQELNHPKFKSREEVGPEYYDSAYRIAKKICCSGRALNEIIGNIFRKNNDKLVENMKKRPLVVQLLLVNPYSTYLEKMDPNGQEDIKANLRKVFKYCSKIEKLDRQENSDGLLSFYRGSCLEIKLTTWPLNTTLFYYEPQNRGKRKMLLGMLYNGINGRDSEAYEMEQSTVQPFLDLFDHNKRNFDTTWQAAHQFLVIENREGRYVMKLTPPPQMEENMPPSRKVWR